MVVDKERSGKVEIKNFMRIMQVCGMKVDSIDLMKFTN